MLHNLKKYAFQRHIHIRQLLVAGIRANKILSILDNMVESFEAFFRPSWILQGI